MDQQKRKSFPILWILVLLAVLVAWWYLRGDQDDLRDEIAASQAVALDALGADPDDILIDLRDDATDATVASIERALGIDLVLVSRESLDERFYRAHVDPARRTALLAALSARSDVEIAEPDAQVTLSPSEAIPARPSAAWEGFPNDPKYKYQWHLRQIGMPEAWKLADGNGVVVAVIDTGVAYENFQRFHQVEDLTSVEFVSPYNFVSDGAHGNDDHGHGTHVAGTIAQATNNGIGVAGVARNVKIMPLKVLSAGGSGTVAGIADAIRYAADKGAKVINMSLGGPFPSRVLKKACEYAVSKGVTVIAAAGNDGRNRVGYPAAYPGVVAVAATRYDEQTTFYSNWGKDVDIAAPGGDTRVDQNGDGMPDGVLQNTIVVGDPTHSDYFAFMGTSMASPHVAGVAALVVGEGVTDPAMVEKVLLETARKPKDQKYDRDRYGAGIVDAQAAVLRAREIAGAAKTAAEHPRGDSAGGGSLLWHLLLGALVGVAAAVATRRRRLGSRSARFYLAGAAAAVLAIVVLPLIAVLVAGAVVAAAVLRR